MIKEFKKGYGLRLLISCSLTVILGSCSSANLRSESSQIDSQKANQNTTGGKTDKLDSSSYQGSLLNVDGLLKQLEKANTNSELQRQSDKLLKAALDSQSRNDWGGATKGFAYSIGFKPSNEAILGYAKARIMTNVYTLNPKESLNTKIRNFKEAIKIYQVAIQFSQRANKPLSNEQKQSIQTNITCLGAFIKSPNPKVPTCQIVKEALRASKIS
jgi:hypothetical protein